MTDKMDSFEAGLAAHCAQKGLSFRKWKEIPRAQVFEVGTSPKLLIYAKDSALRIGWWGVAFTIYKRLSASTLDWRLVLLVRSGEEAYLLTRAQIGGMVSALSTNATEYILHERDATAGQYFKAFNDLFQRLTV
jgi:hypothetical protein